MRSLGMTVLLFATGAIALGFFQTSLFSRHLALPVQNMKLSDMLDTFKQSRGGGRTHEATDIIAPRRTPVLAVDDGIVVKLFLSKAGGRTIYEFDPSEHYCYYYAHLDGYEAHLMEGTRVHRGQLIGYVGTTGNAPPNTPHLHFAINLLAADKKWWGGTPIDPYPILMASARELSIEK